MATLIITSGKDAGAHYPLGQRTNVVGRDEGVLIQIIDERVSRKHLQIRFDKEHDRYLATDMKSRHGVFINGDRIRAETGLKDNDLIDIGGVTLLFTLLEFQDREGALAHYRKVGERVRGTLLD